MSALVASTVAVIAPAAPPVRAQEAPVTTLSLGEGLDPGKIRYVAGVESQVGFSGDGGPAREALLRGVEGLDFDAAGNLYLADRGNDRIRRVDAATGIITTVAGGGSTSGFGDGGPATSAFLNSPYDVAVGPDGDLYIADSSNQRIRRVDMDTGTISTLAGGGTPLYNNGGFAGDGGPAATARLHFPTGVAVAANGDVYIADTNNQRIRKVDAVTGIITTIAGNGVAAYGGDGRPATDASLDRPYGVVVDDAGNVFIGDTSNNRVRRVDATTGIITTYAGGGTASGAIGNAGVATVAQLARPRGLDLDGAGNLFIAEEGGNAIRRVDAATGIIGTVAGGGFCTGDDCPAIQVQVSQPYGIAVGPGGLLAVDVAQRVGVVQPDVQPDPVTGVVARFVAAGCCSPDFLSVTWTLPVTAVNRIVAVASPGGASASASGTATSTGIAGLTRGEQYVAIVRSFNGWAFSSGVSSAPTWFGTPPAPGTVAGVAAPPPGELGVVAGTGVPGFAGDGGPATQAQLRNPQGVAWDSAGNLYIADRGNGRVRRVAASTGVITTVAGDGTNASSGDGGPATQAQLGLPFAVAVAPDGDLLIAEYGGHRIRRVDADTGLISTIAGTGVAGYSGDAGPATAARINQPRGLTVLPDGAVVIADTANQRVRRIDPVTGTITTIAGTGEQVTSGDGIPAVEAAVCQPEGVSADGAGNLYVGDGCVFGVRRIDAATGVITTVVRRTLVFGGLGDGVPATETNSTAPSAIDIDPAGNLFLADAGRSSVRRVDAATGIIGTVAGGGSGPVDATSGSAIDSALGIPRGLALHPSGAVAVTVPDSLSSHFVRVISPDGPPAAPTGVSAAASDKNQISVAWSAPPEPLNAARVVVSPVGTTRVIERYELPSGSVDLYSLPPGPVTVTVEAFNGWGYSAPSAPSPSVDVYGDPTTVLATEVQVGEGDGGVTEVEVPIRLDVPASTTLSFGWRTQDGTATSGGDYRFGDGAVEFRPGEIEQVVTVQVYGDTSAEPDEHFTIEIEGFAASGPLTVVILNDDGAPPTLFDQFDADATGTAPVNAFLLNLLANAVYKETWDPDHSARTDESWRQLMTQRAAEWGLSDLSFDISNTGTGTQSIAVRTDEALIVSFRGTEPNERADVITDGGVALIPVATPYGLVNVHAGFWGALDSVYPELLAMAQEVPGAPVWLTGHSLGGSLAALAAFRLSLDGVTVGGVHTVGAPAVGGLALTLVYDESLGLRDRTQRWVNDHDVVPMAFDLLNGYADLGTTNVFVRTSLDDPRSFEYVLDSPVEPLTSPSLDEHDDALYATRIWELIRRTDPAAAAALPEPEPPYLRPTGTDTERLVRYLVTYFTGQLDLLIAGLVEEAQLTALEAATLMREAEATYTLIARVLYDGYQLTLDEIRAALADLGATLAEIEEALAALVDELGSLLNDGLAAAGGTLADWAAALGFSGDASLLPADLAALFGIDDLLAAVELPTFDPAATLEQIVDALPPGVTVDWAEGVVGTPPTAEDRFQARYVLTVDDLSSFTDPVSGSAAGVLDGLAESVGLTGSGSWNGSLTLSVVFGVDSVGFYLDPSSALVLDIDGTVTVATAADATVAGVAAPVSGTATADVTATVAPSGPERVRPGGIPEPTATTTTSTSTAGISSGTLGLTAGLTGTVATTLDATLGDVVLTWSGTWDVSAAAGSASATLRAGATLGGTATLTFLDNGGSPAVVSLTGVLEPEGWRIGGGLTGQLSAAGVTVTAATLDALLTPTATFSGTGTLDAEVTLAGTATIAGPLVVGWGHTGTTVSGDMKLDGVTAGSLASFDGITLSFTAASDGIDVAMSSKTGGQIVLFPDQQLLTVTEPSGSLTTAGVLTFSAAGATGLVAGAVEIEALNPAITLGPPGSEPSVLLDLPSVVGTVPSLGGASVTFTGLQLLDDGTFRAASVQADPADITATLGIAGVLPFDITSVLIAFPDPSNLDRFDATVTGTVDFSAFADLPFTPILTIGSRTVEPGNAAQPFELTVRADSFSAGDIRPLDVSPITIGFADLQAGPVMLGATLTLGGYVDGVFLPSAGGTLDVSVDADGWSAAAAADLTGDLTPTATGAVLDLSGTLTIDGAFEDAFELVGLTLAARLRLVADNGVLTMDPLDLDDLAVEQVSVTLPDLVRVTAEDVTVDLAPAIGSDLVVFGAAGIEFLDPVLSGWGGTAGNVALRLVEGPDGLPVIVPVLLPGFSLDIDVGDGETFGLPDWLPFTVRSAGLTLPNVDPTTLTEPVVITRDLLVGTRLRVSGGFAATRSFPVTAEVEGLEVDLGLLVKPDFPITNLEAVLFGVEPFSIGPITIGGGAGLGMVNVDVDPDPQVEQIERVFFFRVFGEFAYAGFGAGVDLVLTQYGPVLAELKAPVPIPLGTTGLMLAGVRGGIQFGGDGLAPPADPEDLLDGDEYQLDFAVNLDTIAESVASCARENAGRTGIPDASWPCFTWNDGGLVYIGASLTSYAAPGVVSGNLTGAIDLRFGARGTLPKLRLAAAGDVDVYGFKIARAGVLLSLDDPLAPTLDMAMRMPDLDGPLGFLMGANGLFTVRLDTEGIAAGAIEASRVLLQEVSAAGATGGQELLADALDSLALSLEQARALTGADREELERVAPYRPLATALLDLDGNGTLSPAEEGRVITGTFLLDRLLGTRTVPGLLPASYPATPAGLDALRNGPLPRTLSAFQTALLAEAQRLAEVSGNGYDLAALLADPTVQQYGVAGVAFLQQMTSAVIAGLQQGAAAWGAVFDPTLVIEGGIQPVILGVPLGEPTDKGTFYINRTEVGFGMSASLESIALVLFGGNVGLTVVELNKVWGVNTIVDQVGTLPVPDVFQALATGNLVSLDPFSSDWRVRMGVTTKVAGFTLGQGSALLVPPENESVMADGLCRLDDQQSFPCVGDRIPVNGQAHWDAIYANGGLVLSYEMLAPRFVTDPAGVLAYLKLDPPDDLLGWIPLIEDNLAAITAQEQVGRWQVYVPSFLAILDPRYAIERTWPTAGTDLERFGFESFEAIKTDMEEIWSTAYAEGVWDVQLLGIPLANGTMSVDDTGYRVDAAFPPFGDVPVTFSFGGVTVTAGGSPVTLPVPGFDVSVTSAELDEVLASFGLPPTVSRSARSTGRLQAYGPGYDPESANPLQRTGGLRIEATLDLDGLVTGARFALEVGGTDPATADLYGTASVAQLQPAPGVTITDAVLTLERVDGVLTVSVDGEASTPIGAATVSGSLSSTLEGTLLLTVGGGAVNLDGFVLQAAAELTFERDARGQLLTTFTVGGTMSIPPLGIVDATAVATVGPKGVEQVAVAATTATLGPIQLTNASLTLVQEPPGSGTYRLSVSGTTTVPGVQGTLAISGSIASNGTGSFSVTLPGNTLTVGGSSASSQLTLSNATLTINATTSGLTLAASGTTSILGTSVALSGSLTITSSGVSGFLEGSAPSVTFGAATLAGTFRVTFGGGNPSLSFSGTATIPGVGSALAVTGSVNPAGTSTLTLTTGTLALDGFSLTGGTFKLIRTVSGSTVTTKLDILASFSVLGRSATVDGELTVSGTGISGEIALSASSPFSIDGFSLDGGLFLTFAGTGVSIRVASELSVEGIGDFDVEGALDTTSGVLTGLLSVKGDTLLALGGSDSSLSLDVGGTMELTRALVDDEPITTFTVRGVTLGWDGVTSFPLPDVSIASDGSLAVNGSSHTFSVGQLTVTLPSLALSVAPAGAGASVTFGNGTLAIAGITPSSITVPGFSVGTDGGFVRTLTGLPSLGLGGYAANGPFVFERVNGVFRLRLTQASTLGVPGLPSPVSLDTFVLGSNGTVAAGISVERIGPDGLSIRRASITFTRTATQSARLTVTGGWLYLPVGDPVELPTLTFTSDGTLTQSFRKLVRLGAGLAVSEGSANWLQLTASDGVLKLAQTQNRTFTLLGASATLSGLEVTSAGGFSGTVTGTLKPLGFELANGTFTLSKPATSPNVRLTVSTANPFTVTFWSVEDGFGNEIGSVTASVTGWVDTGGRFELQASGNVDVPIVVGTFEGSLSVGLRNTGLVSGSVDTEVCNNVGQCADLGSLTVNGSGNASWSAFGASGTVNLIPIGALLPDTVPPTFARIDDVVVSTASAPVAVTYALPTATDDRSASVTVTCSPAPGSSFPSGDTVVSCTAKDAANNQATRTFVLSVVFSGFASVSGTWTVGGTASVEAAGFAPGSTVSGTMYSTPVALGSATADAGGRLVLTFTVPLVESGRHHVQIAGVAPDGSALIAVIPIDVVASPSPPPPTPVSPVSPVLPRTGNSTTIVVWVASLLLALGATLVAINRALRRVCLDRRRP